MKTIACLVGLMLLASCQTLTNSYLERAKGASEGPEYDFSNLQKLVSEGDCQKALVELDAFQKKFPQSPYEQNLSLLRGDCLLQTEDYIGATIILRQVASFSVSNQPRIAAPAFLLLSYSYEGLADVDRALSAALDAERFAADLSVPQRLAEVPARLAMLYSQMNDLTAARAYLLKADEGLKVLQSQNPEILGSVFWAKVYYQMGFKTLEQADHTSLSSLIKGLMTVQKFSLKSLEFNDAVWTPRALTQLKRNYSILWSLIERPDPNPHASLREDQMALWLSEFSDLLYQARLLQPHEEHQQPPASTEFFNFLAILESKLEGRLESVARKNPLTPESLKLNSTFRPGQVYPTQFFPVEIPSSSQPPIQQNLETKK